jgi:REP element-mobilizing transposase RayT
MARPLRIEYEGAVYHIMGKGNRGEFIFSEDRDKEVCLDFLERAGQRYGITVYGWCIMGNHYHLLISTPERTLGRAMHFIGSGYGSYMRRYRGWIGHVFAGRYKSICVEKESYLLELSRYLHLNPVKAGVVKKPEEYRWSSYRHYIGKEKSPKWLHTEWLLAEYGRTDRTAGNRYKEFVESGMDKPGEYPAERIVGQAVIGSDGFVQKVIKKVNKGKERADATAKRAFSGKPGADEIYRIVSEYYGEKDLLGNRRAQEMFVCLAKEAGNSLNREIAEKVGVKCPSAITHQYKRTLKRMEGERKGKKRWEKEKSAILSRFKG